LIGRGPALVPAFAACALATVAAVPSAPAATTPAAKPPTSHKKKLPTPQLAITRSLLARPGVTVTMPPAGLSIEYPTMAQQLGPGACPPPALTAELERLGSPPIELAGVSQDETVPQGAAPNPAANWEEANLYQLPGSFWSQLHCLIAAARDPLTAGLNVRTGQLAWATQMVEGARGAAVAGLSVALGNEPDLYDLPNYGSLDKPFAEQEVARTRLYAQLAAYLRPAAGGAPLIGPELARPEVWRALLPGVLQAVGLQTVGVHMYPLTACGSPRAVTIKGLLSSRVAEAPTRLAWVIAEARAAGLPAIISEANSASCGGLAGVSDSPAAAVWGTRFVLSALKTGFREVRFHLSGNSYDPFFVRGSEVLDRPLESALVALNQWLPVGASLRSVTGVGDILTTAIGSPGGGLLVVLDNEQSSARPIVLTGARRFHVWTERPTLAAPVAALLPAPGRRLSLSLPANSVVAVSPSP
jgi:hypothetical protein